MQNIFLCVRLSIQSQQSLLLVVQIIMAFAVHDVISFYSTYTTLKCKHIFLNVY